MEARLEGLERSKYTTYAVLGESVLEQGKGLVLGALSETPERGMFGTPPSPRAPALPAALIHPRLPHHCSLPCAPLSLSCTLNPPHNSVTIPGFRSSKGRLTFYFTCIHGACCVITAETKSETPGLMK